MFATVPQPSAARRRSAATLTAGLLILAAASPAGAAQTLGQTYATSNCGTNQVLVQKATAGAQTYQAQSSGVIVSWSYRAAANPPNLRFGVYRATADPAKWFLRSQSAQRTAGAGADQVKASQLNTFAERPGLRIEAGDVLGLEGKAGTNISCDDAASNSDLLRVRDAGSPQTVGQENSNFLGENPKQRIGVSAVVEADADNDGFGDETQDGCPTEASVNAGPCPDADGDGLSDSVDACPNDSDASSQRDPRTGCPVDSDGDGAFDTADPDDDNDGVLDPDDKFPLDPSQYLTPATTGNDTIVGTTRDDVICGLGGNDKLSGAAGNDTLWGDTCNDKAKRIFGAQAPTDGKDTLSGGDGHDSLYGAGGNDRLKGQAGKDKLFGGEGNDTLEGGDGKDSLNGGNGRDKLNGGKDADKFSAGAGDDTVNAKDGKKETVDCGKGSRDKATVDKADTVKRCETVVRAKK